MMIVSRLTILNSQFSISLISVRPVPRSRVGHEHNLSKLSSRFHPLVGLHGPGYGEDPIDDGREPARRDGREKLSELLVVGHRRAQDRDPFPEDQPDLLLGI